MTRFSLTSLSPCPLFSTLLTVCSFQFPVTWACEPDQAHNGCKIYGGACTCGYGCRTEYVYRTRRSCLNALRGELQGWSVALGTEAELKVNCSYSKSKNDDVLSSGSVKRDSTLRRTKSVKCGAKSGLFNMQINKYSILFYSIIHFTSRL